MQRQEKAEKRGIWMQDTTNELLTSTLARGRYPGTVAVMPPRCLTFKPMILCQRLAAGFAEPVIL